MKLLRLFAICMPLLLCGSNAMYADNFRQHRYEAFKGIPPVDENNQIIFYGNSITNMHQWWEAFGADQNIGNRGTGGATTAELLENVESVVASKPAKLFLCIGTNDLGGSVSPKEVALNIETLVKRIHISSPKTHIYVESILPRQRDDIYAKIQVTNDLLVEYFKTAEDYVEYIDLTDVLMGIRTPSRNEGSYSYDGTHPTGYAYREWVKAICDKVNGQNSYIQDVGNNYNGIENNAYAMQLTQMGMLPINEDDVVILGEELMNAGEWHEYLRSNKVKSHCGGWSYGGGPTLDEAVKWVEVILNTSEQQKAPAKMFLYYGVAEANSASTEEARTTFQTKYKAIVTRAHELDPTSKIYILSLIPTSGTLSNVAACNTKLQEIATELAATDEYKDLIEYVDIYTPLLNNGAQDSSCFSAANFLNGRGYVRITNVLAKYIDGTTAIDESEYDKYYADRDYRNQVGIQLNSLLKITTGDDLNQVGSAGKAELEKGISDISEIITKDADVTADDVATAKSIASTTINAIAQYINLPNETNENGETNWYRITSWREQKSIADQGNNTVNGVVYNESAENSTGEELWKFVKRNDGSYDIINKRYNTYLAPGSTIASSDTQPESGWNIGYSTYAPGSYIIYYESSAQLNQLSSSATITNWGMNVYSDGPIRSDQGCSYYFTLFSGKIYEPISTGWYTIDVASGLSNYINAGTNHLINADTEFLQNNTNSYPLMLSSAPSTDKEATAFIHITITGSTFQFTGLNGHGIQSNATACADALPTSNPTLTVSDIEKGIYSIGKWSEYNTGSGIYVGQNSGSSNTFQLNSVSTETLSKYDIWTVDILNSTDGTLPFYNAKATLGNNIKNAGLSTVYNNGTFFISAGTTLSTNDISVTNSNNEEADKSATVSIDNTSHTITIDYAPIVSGIEQISVNNLTPVNNDIYDITGRRLTHITRPGVYIINGHKTFVRP
jgi:lysophospholipase L1-like esterase